jgi:hypothetical protein
MKRQTREYNYDWMLWSTYGTASKLSNGTQKELNATIKTLPSYSALLKTATYFGEVGDLLFKVASEYFDNILTAREKGKKIALGTFTCNKLIAYAFEGLVPVWAEPMTVLAQIAFRHGIWEFYDYGCEMGLTETSCAAQRGYIGAVLADLAIKPDIGIIGACGPCDTNSNSIQFYAALKDIPVVVIDTPAKLVDPKVDEFQVTDLKAFAAEIDRLTGCRINEGNLRQLLEEKRRQDELLAELMDLMFLVPCPVPAIFHIFTYFATMIMPGKKCTTNLFEAIVKYSRKNAKEGRAGTYSGKERARVEMFCLEHYSIDAQCYEWFMANDISLIPCIVLTTWHPGAQYTVGREDEEYKIDTSDMESMIRTLSQINSRQAMTKQLRGPYDAPTQWLSEIKHLTKLMKPDCLVYISSVGCRNTWGIIKMIQRVMESEGVPTLLVFGDVFDERVTSWKSISESMSEFMKIRRIGSWSSQDAMLGH